MMIHSASHATSSPAMARRGPHSPPSPAGSIDMMGAVVAVARNAEIYGEGEAADYVYKVVRGAVRTSKILADGRRQVGAFYFAGDMFGLESGDEHVFSAEAIDAAQVVVVRRSALVALAARDAAVAREVWSLIGGELARAQAHGLLLVTTAQERVAGFLLDMAARQGARDLVELPMTRQDIADYLGLSVETVSRTLTGLAGDAAIELPNARRVALRNLPALRRLIA